MQTAYFNFVGPINDEVAQRICNSFTNALKDADQLGQKTFASVHLTMTSEGGNVESAIHLHNYIKSFPLPVTIHASAEIASAAVLFFAAGTKRTCSIYSSFLLHPTTYNFGGIKADYQAIQEKLRVLERLETRTNLILQDSFKLPHETLQRRLVEEFVVTPDEAKKHGIVSEIVEPKIPPGYVVHQI